MNLLHSTGLPVWHQDSHGDAIEELPRGLRRTYRFPDGVRVMVLAYDVVIWVYPDGRQAHSVSLKSDG